MLTLADLVTLGRRQAELNQARITLPTVMAAVNLSQDSTYTSSIAQSTEEAVAMGVQAIADGADIVDLGAESTTASAHRVDREEQCAELVPAVRGLVESGVCVSVETYDLLVCKAALDAGASWINLTGQDHDGEIFAEIAAAKAGVVISFTRADTVKSHVAAPVGPRAYDEIREQLATRSTLALQAGINDVVIDPGLGFYYANLTDPRTRADHQARMLLTTFELAELGLPICQSLPNARVYFEDEFETAEAFYATLALLGGASMLRTHEVRRILPVIRALHALSAEG